MRVLIMGCGGVGTLVAETLSQVGHDVVVLDSNPESFRRLSEDLKRKAIVGDGTQREDLTTAGIDEVEVFVAVSSSDTANALASQMAKHVYQVDKVICRINDPANYAMYTDLGLDTVSATQVVSHLIVEKVSG
jgi:trk system potassium uptake protein TrkA